MTILTSKLDNDKFMKFPRFCLVAEKLRQIKKVMIYTGIYPQLYMSKE